MTPVFGIALIVTGILVGASILTFIVYAVITEMAKQRAEAPPDPEDGTT